MGVQVTLVLYRRGGEHGVLSRLVEQNRLNPSGNKRMRTNYTVLTLELSLFLGQGYNILWYNDHTYRLLIFCVARYARVLSSAIARLAWTDGTDVLTVPAL